MPEYAVFGGCLASAIDFPELRSLPQASPDWTLLIGDGAAPEHGGDVLGADQLDETTQVRLLRHPHGLRLQFTDTGTFDILGQGRQVTWFPDAAADLPTVRSDVLGRVLACALHEQGAYVAHASGVVLGTRAIGFLAAKGTGKSTLALALVQHGAQLLTDDTLPLETGATGCRARPGVHSVRLWQDSAAAVAGATPLSVSASGKLEARALEPRQLATHPVALDALYVLTPVEGGHAPSRTVLPAMHAAMMLVQHSRLGPLLGGLEGPTVLRRASAIAQRVPVHVLGVPRALDRLPAVVQQLEAWHSA
jgi:hypothetical protein